VTHGPLGPYTQKVGAASALTGDSCEFLTRNAPDERGTEGDKSGELGHLPALLARRRNLPNRGLGGLPSNWRRGPSASKQASRQVFIEFATCD
jgi:hypothetical protein